MNKCSLFTRSVLEHVIVELHHPFAARRVQVGEEHGALAARQASPLRLRLRHGLLVELLHSQHVHCVHKRLYFLSVPKVLHSYLNVKLLLHCVLYIVLLCSAGL